MSHTLYATTNRRRFFFLPNDVDLPEGDLVLQSLRGRRLEVELDAVLPYELPEDEARRLARKSVRDAARGMRRFLMGAAGVFASAASDPDGVSEVRGDATLGEALGLDEAQASDSRAVAGGLKRVGAGVLETLRQGLTPGDEQEAARERMERLAGYARDEVGSPIGDAVEATPVVLRHAVEATGLREHLTELTSHLRTAASELRRSAGAEE